MLERARIDGVELEYEVSGSGEPVVFLQSAAAVVEIVRVAGIVTQEHLLECVPRCRYPSHTSHPTRRSTRPRLGAQASQRHVRGRD